MDQRTPLLAQVQEHSVRQTILQLLAIRCTCAVQDRAGRDQLDSVEAQADDRTEAAAGSDEVTGPKAKHAGIYYSDKGLLGLGLYALSSVFLATMLICAKTLKQHGFPVWQNLLARSLSIMTFSLIACARQRVNPFGNRSAYQQHDHCMCTIMLAALSTCLLSISLNAAVHACMHNFGGLRVMKLALKPHICSVGFQHLCLPAAAC